MVKIKVKKEMNLPELVQWGWKNGVTKSFYGSESGKVVFGHVGWVSSTLISQNETFEVEIEEEITEETEIPRLIEVYEYDGILGTHLNTKMSIKKVLNDSQSNLLYVPKAFYMLNDDMTMKLLWKDGEMVE